MLGSSSVTNSPHNTIKAEEVSLLTAAELMKMRSVKSKQDAEIISTRCNYETIGRLVVKTWFSNEKNITPDMVEEFLTLILLEKNMLRMEVIGL